MGLDEKKKIQRESTEKKKTTCGIQLYGRTLSCYNNDTDTHAYI